MSIHTSVAVFEGIHFWKIVRPEGIHVFFWTEIRFPQRVLDWAEKKSSSIWWFWKSSAGRVFNPKLCHPEKAWIRTTAISRFVLCLFGKSWVFCQRLKRWEFQHVSVVDFFEAVFGVPVYWHGLGWVIHIYTSSLWSNCRVQPSFGCRRITWSCPALEKMGGNKHTEL